MAAWRLGPVAKPCVSGGVGCSWCVAALPAPCRRIGPPPALTATGDSEALRYNGRYRMPARAPLDTVLPNNTAQAGPERYYYAYSHRNVRFISISTEHALDPGSEQYAWLETELAAADTRQARQQRPWVLLFGHKPPVCSHADVCGEAAVPLQLLARHHVDLALWGHLHAYERCAAALHRAEAWRR